MKPNRFARGLSKEFIEALNRQYEDGDGWWRTLADDKNLYVGIRENYINVYFNGGSILELKYNKSKGFSGSTHFKYLLNLTREQEREDYVRFENGKFRPVLIKDSYRDIATDITKIKEAARRHQGDEKKGVHQISIKNKNVIDVEIQIPGAKGRIDFAALQRIKGEIKIVFFEAKLYSNGELRRPASHPRVLTQIEKYNENLSKRCSEIEESYAHVAKNIVEMNGWNRRRDDIFSEAASGNLSVDPEVRLAIFGFDDPQRNAAIGKDGLFPRLRLGLERDHVIARGNPDDFWQAIESPE